MNVEGNWIGFGRSETGHVRQSNQDVFAAIDNCRFWIVADGMGGHHGGDIAARLAVDTITGHAQALFSQTEQAPGTIGQHLTECLIAANEAIHRKTLEEPSLKGMGTTAVAMALIPAPAPIAYIAHLGDSRAYRFHKGTLTQLTRDHSLVNLLLERGVLDATTARSYPDQHILVKGLGMGLNMKPDLVSTPLDHADLIVLCSDGLTKMLDDETLCSLLSQSNGNPRRACDTLVEEALRRGGEDNVTVIVCGFVRCRDSRGLPIDKTSPAM